MRRKLAAGNWKMNGLSGALKEAEALLSAHPSNVADIVLCPPATLLSRMATVLADGVIAVGGQDCHGENSGPHTGDISAAMLADAGASYVIVGHSERRQDHGESDADVCAKATVAATAGLTAIICMGESEAQREAGNTLDVIGGQLTGSVPDNTSADALVIAYEPVWAIGTGRVPSPRQIGEAHDFIRERLIRRFGGEAGKDIRILYGGSVKPDNAADIFTIANVDGALVGGASLKATDFSPIVRALEASAQGGG